MNIVKYVKCKYKDGLDSHVLKGKPEDIGCVVFDYGKSNRAVQEDHCVNGTFFSHQADGKLYTTSPLIVDGKAYRWASNHGKPQSCFIIYKDNTVEMKRVNSISELDINNIKYLFGGLGLVNKLDKNFKYDPASEGFSGKFSDVLRDCEKTVIAYRDGEVFLLVTDMEHSDRYKYDLLELCEDHDFDIAISLDGGGSTFFRYNGIVKESGDGRKVHNIITMNGIDETKVSPLDKIEEVCLDYGHRNTSWDYGASDEERTVKESQLVFVIGEKVKEQLIKNDVKVTLTRKDENTIVSLEERVNISNKIRPDLFLSLHANSYSDENVNGVEVCHYKGTQNKTKASNMSDMICKYTGAKNRGPKERNDLYVLRKTYDLALLVECGFLTNEQELSNLTLDEYQNKIVKGIIESLGLTYYEVKTEPKIWYRAVCGSFSTYQGAQDRLKDLQKNGYKDAFIVAFEK